MENLAIEPALPVDVPPVFPPKSVDMEDLLQLYIHAVSPIIARIRVSFFMILLLIGGPTIRIG